MLIWQKYIDLFINTSGRTLIIHSRAIIGSKKTPFHQQQWQTEKNIDHSIALNFTHRPDLAVKRQVLKVVLPSAWVGNGLGKYKIPFSDK